MEYQCVFESAYFGMSISSFSDMPLTALCFLYMFSAEDTKETDGADEKEFGILIFIHLSNDYEW